MNTDIKKFLLIFGGGMLLFWAFQKIKPIGIPSSKQKGKKKSKVASLEEKKNAAIMMKAYMDAKAAGESPAFLEELNQEFYRKYQMKIVPDKTSGKPYVSDMEGNKIV